MTTDDLAAAAAFLTHLTGWPVQDIVDSRDFGSGLENLGLTLAFLGAPACVYISAYSVITWRRIPRLANLAGAIGGVLIVWARLGLQAVALEVVSAAVEGADAYRSAPSKVEAAIWILWPLGWAAVFGMALLVAPGGIRWLRTVFGAAAVGFLIVVADLPAQFVLFALGSTDSCTRDCWTARHAGAFTLSAFAVGLAVTLPIAVASMVPRTSA